MGEKADDDLECPAGTQVKVRKAGEVQTCCWAESPLEREVTAEVASLEGGLGKERAQEEQRQLWQPWRDRFIGGKRMGKALAEEKADRLWRDRNSGP